MKLNSSYTIEDYSVSGSYNSILELLVYFIDIYS